MPLVLLVVFQLAILVCWYVVPAAAALPAWVVFIPLMLIGVWVLCVALVWIVFAFICWRSF